VLAFVSEQDSSHAEIKISAYAVDRVKPPDPWLLGTAALVYPQQDQQDAKENKSNQEAKPEKQRDEKPATPELQQLTLVIATTSDEPTLALAAAAVKKCRSGKKGMATLATERDNPKARATGE
jgi:hypothetical protein